MHTEGKVALSSASDRCVRSSCYSATQLCELAALLERRTPNLNITVDDLESALIDLMRAVGRKVDDDQETALFREFAQDDPSHAELAEQFQAIASSDVPLLTSINLEATFAELNAAVCLRWRGRGRQDQMDRPISLLGKTSDLLSCEEIQDIRMTARHLAQFHQSLVRAGAPNKIDQDTLLEGVADIFVRFAQLSCHPSDLPHSKDSHFITFAFLAMRPFFAVTEVSKSAISKRWKRLKDKFQDSPPPAE